jgi:hypothetical protein
VPHQKDLHPLLPPGTRPGPTVVHERSVRGQRFAGGLACAALLTLLAVSCRTRPVPSAAPAEADAPAVTAEGEVDAGPYRLTAAKLDAFLVYKRAVLDAGEPSLAQLRALLRAVDAGEPGAVDRAWAVLRAQGVREAAARARAGLSAAEVRVIEPMAADVAAARVFARPLGLGKLSEDLAAARNSIPADRRAAVDSTLETLRQDEARLERLADEREAWGDANVDLLLSRERDLVRLYEAQLRGTLRAGGSPDAGR